MKIKLKAKKKDFYVLERDGVTQSLLAMFLACRQKARFYLQGWNSRFVSNALMYGALGHGMLELAYKDVLGGKLKSVPAKAAIVQYSKAVEKEWLRENPKVKGETIEQLETSLALLEETLPRYFAFWKKDFKDVKWKGLEKQFDILVDVGGVKIRIRGKKDGRFTLRNELWVLETKTKSMINEQDLVDALSLDLQVNLYLWADWAEYKEMPTGVLYNIIRKTAIKPRTNETIPQYARRVGEDMDDRPEFYFVRLEVPILKQDMLAFKAELAGLLGDFKAWCDGKAPHYKNPHSCVTKYGKCEYLAACAQGDFSNLVKRDRVFKELEDF